MTAERSRTGLTDLVQKFLDEELPGRTAEELIKTDSGADLIDTLLVALNRKGVLHQVKLVKDDLYS